MLVNLYVQEQHGMDVFTGESVIMDFGYFGRNDSLKIKCLDGFVSYVALHFT